MTRQPSLYEEPARYARVAVPAPVDDAFSYRVPEALESRAMPGMRVSVRFSGRSLRGVIVETATEPPAGVDPRRVRALDDCLDRDAVVGPLMLMLIQQIASAYLVGPGEVAQLALPPGSGDPAASRRVRIERLPAPTDRLSAAAVSVLEAARASGSGTRWVTASAIRRSTSQPALHAALYELSAAGIATVRDEWSGAEPGSHRIVARLRAGVDSAVAEHATGRAPAQRRALQALLAEPSQQIDAATMSRRLGITHAVLSALECKELVELERRPLEETSCWKLGAGGAGDFVLTGDQERALATVERAIDERAQRAALLHGVTGSGKTEVYLRAAAHALRAGRSALLLVPEIGLTPQLEERARAVLGDRVSVLHSGMADGARARAWWRVRRGDSRVVVGPRSAVFAPLTDVGLIVIDEEQDGAYKQDERPRYNGRDVARWRARLEGAAVLLGSATPAVESYRQASTGEWELLRLPHRVRRQPMPEVSLVDMRREWKECGRSLVSRRLEDSIVARLERREQALILLNRRGFAAVLLCRVCGERVECPHCAVSLAVHRSDRTLRCHYCDHRKPVPSVCVACGASVLHDIGHGTERLQAALRQRFAGARIERFDADQTQRRGSHARILSRFGKGEIDVLVGTQMLAKGHDFPGVTLVGVVGADSSLSMPDFRAAERTFQLLTQMAGRAGRGEVAGEVVLQAHQPDHYAIEAAMQHDFVAFYEREIEYRRRLRYPPFVVLAACVCRGKLAASVKEEADRLAAALRTDMGEGIEVFGPASPPISRLRSKYRVQLLLKGPTRRDLSDHLRRSMRRLRQARCLPRDLVIDIDPQNLL